MANQIPEEQDPDDVDYDPDVRRTYDNPDDPMFDDCDLEFAEPGGNSALRAASASNPRNLPCPNCGRPNMLTPADRARSYQCDSCADAAEGGYGP